MNGIFLIPANSKKSMLIFGLFYPFDLILFGTGLGVTLIMIMFFPVTEIAWAIISILPAVITGFLVFPLPNYHNVLTILISAVTFFTTRQKFVWKGWCVINEIDNTKK